MIDAKIDITVQPEDKEPSLAHGRAFTDEQDGGKRLTDASFVDDLTVYAAPRATTPAAIERTAKRTIEVVVKWTHAYGMRPHAAKTKLMLILHGDKSRITNEALAKQQYGSVQHPLLDEPARFVRQLVTLGTVITQPRKQGLNLKGRTENQNV